MEAKTSNLSNVFFADAKPWDILLVDVLFCAFMVMSSKSSVCANAA
jgi:hypothetical protein